MCRIWHCKRGYLYSKDNKDNVIDFKTKLNKITIAFLDLNTNILYYNSEYINRFKYAKHHIEKDYKEDIIMFSEYTTL